MKALQIPLLLLCALSLASSLTRADDTDKLKDILVANEDWQPVTTGLGFADGLSCDGTTGAIVFSDMKAPALFTLSPDGEKAKFHDGKFSGTRPSADGKTLFVIGNKRLASISIPDGAETVLAENIGTNDLTVTREGRIYFTGNGKGQVSSYDPKTKAVTIVDAGHLKNPNGIGLSPDQKTLIVSDYGGVNVWTFAIQSDGTLADPKPLMTMKAPEKKPDVAGGDGMAIDATGRAFVTTAMGIQVFAASGDALGTIPKPKEGPLVSCAFGGKDLGYLYAACGDTVFRRKVKAKGMAAQRP